MNNILTLYDMEFKRIYKIFFACLGLLLVANIGATVLSMYNVVRSIALQEGVNKSLDILRGSKGLTYVYHYLINELASMTTFTFAIAILMCLGYALVIWYRDYYSKNKTIAALFMLPQPRFNIYISKLLLIVTLIFLVISFQVLFWFIDLSILKIVLNINNKGFTDVFSTILYNNITLMKLISPSISTFIMIDFLGVILAVVVIFTGVLIQRSYKKLGVFLGIIYIGAVIMLYIFLSGYYGIYTDILLKVHLAYYAVIFAGSMYLSNKLLNKKVYL
ncbi:hypothetical protein CHL78_011645 [Romboutsia weinsteinii]|uniref:Uncharacterized protein n=1 Tax=Romboutsia weinsteinii TaxID=2020949 RepID=A0A371J2G2_9FIRM|nr:hypothetical protein [Romboutsia weinsteinii]RDY26846.1 hypothetical protein CHL78_011645 [Romboutsia weinsteinii]